MRISSSVHAAIPLLAAVIVVEILILAMHRHGEVDRLKGIQTCQGIFVNVFKVKVGL